MMSSPMPAKKLPVGCATPCARSRSSRSANLTRLGSSKAAPSPTWKRFSLLERRSASSVPTSRGSSRSTAGRASSAARSAITTPGRWSASRLLLATLSRDWQRRIVRCCFGRCGPSIPALEVIKACGFDYKTAGFLWVKTEKDAGVISLDGEGLHWGMGYHTRANTETCLLATRGSPQRLAKDVHQIVIAPVGDEHSAKPDEVYRRIERLYPGPYLELFARKPRDGWTTWGNEIPRERFGEAA